MLKEQADSNPQGIQSVLGGFLGGGSSSQQQQQHQQQQKNEGTVVGGGIEDMLGIYCLSV